MTYFRLALKGSLGRPLQSAITAGGVALAIGAAFSLLSFQLGYQRGLRRDLERLGAHILVVPKGCPYEAASLALHGANWPCHLKASYLSEVRAVSGIATAAPVFMSAFYESEARHTVYMGIDTNILAIKPDWRIHGAFPRENELLIGAEVARERDWSIGQIVNLPGLTNAHCKVSGVLAATKSSDDTFIFLPLQEAQQRFRHTNELTHVLVRLKDPNRLDDVTTALRGCDAGMQMNIVPVAHLFGTIQSLSNSTRWFLGCATLTALLAAGAGVSAAFLIAVTERTDEIGLMRALGASSTNIFGIVTAEAMQISLLGSLTGVAGSFALMSHVEKWLRAQLSFAPTQHLLVFDPRIACGCIFVGVILGGFAAVGPAWRAARLSPALAMRKRRI